MFKMKWSNVTENYKGNQINKYPVGGIISSEIEQKDIILDTVTRKLYNFYIMNRNKECIKINYWNDEQPDPKIFKLHSTIILSKVILKQWRGTYSLTIDGPVFQSNWDWYNEVNDEAKEINQSEKQYQLAPGIYVNNIY